jgi:hypothetical protein
MGSFTFTVHPEADREKSASLAAQLLYERMNETRLFLVHVLALIGAALALSLLAASFPEHPSISLYPVGSTGPPRSP